MLYVNPNFGRYVEGKDGVPLDAAESDLLLERLYHLSFPFRCRLSAPFALSSLYLGPFVLYSRLVLFLVSMDWVIDPAQIFAGVQCGVSMSLYLQQGRYGILGQSLLHAQGRCGFQSTPPYLAPRDTSGQ